MIHLMTWTCNECEDTACELCSEDPSVTPKSCPLNFNAKWEGRE